VQGILAGRSILLVLRYRGNSLVGEWERDREEKRRNWRDLAGKGPEKTFALRKARTMVAKETKREKDECAESMKNDFGKKRLWRSYKSRRGEVKKERGKKAGWANTSFCERSQKVLRKKREGKRKGRNTLTNINVDATTGRGPGRITQRYF